MSKHRQRPAGYRGGVAHPALRRSPMLPAQTPATRCRARCGMTRTASEREISGIDLRTQSGTLLHREVVGYVDEVGWEVVGRKAARHSRGAPDGMSMSYTGLHVLRLRSPRSSRKMGEPQECQGSAGSESQQGKAGVYLIQAGQCSVQGYATRCAVSTGRHQ